MITICQWFLCHQCGSRFGSLVSMFIFPHTHANTHSFVVFVDFILYRVASMSASWLYNIQLKTKPKRKSVQIKRLNDNVDTCEEDRLFHSRSHAHPKPLHLSATKCTSLSLSLCPGHLLYDLIKRANVYCNSLTPLLTRLLILIAKIIIYLSFR